MITEIYPIEISGKYGDRLHRKDQARPVMLICETVNRCSLNCIICAYGDMERPKEAMSISLFEKVLSDYAAIGGGALSLTPVVGDIFMDPFLFDRLEIIDAHSDISTLSVTTNAVGLKRFSDEQLRRFCRSMDRIHISVYGLDAHEYFLMSRKNVFEIFVRDVSRLVGLSETPEQFMFGFRLLKTSDEPTIKAWVRDNFGVNAPIGFTTEYANWGTKAVDTPLPNDAKWISLPDKRHPCMIPLVACQIHSNGNVSICPCDDYDADLSLSLGSIVNESLGTLLNNEKHQAFWRDFSTKRPRHCENCSFYQSAEGLGDFLFDRPIDFIGG